MDAATLALLVAAAFLAALIDSIVGGGGLITLPALIAAGLPPHVALGTNKLAATGASSMASVQYVLKGIPHRLALAMFPVAFVGSALGAMTVLSIPATALRAAVLVVLVLMTAYVLARPRFGTRDDQGWLAPGAPHRRLRLAGLVAAAFGIGFYDGFLGPGTGSFLIVAWIGIGGLGFLAAAGSGRVLNFASNAAGLAFFAAAGVVDYRVGLPMMAATLAGGFVGSRFGMRLPAKWLRALFVTVTATLALRLAWDLMSA